MIAAIDGPAGVGKSTIARCAAEKLNLLYINSGSFYRAIALKLLSLGLSPDSEADSVQTAGTCRFDLTSDGSLLLDNERVEHLLRTQEIDMASSKVSTYPEVRNIVNLALRRIAGLHDIIMEGRDITTVVFPDAEVKFYFDASLEVRTRRRMRDFLDPPTYETLRNEISRRDDNDRSKGFGALKQAEDAFYIDTSYLTIDEVCDKVVRKIFEFKQLQDQERSSGN